MTNKLFVFDTNTLISAILIVDSTSRKALNAVIKGGSLVFSDDTFDELASVLVRSKFDKYVSLDNRIDFLKGIEEKALRVVTTSKLTDCRDEKDNKFLNLAVDSRAQSIITGDNDLLVLNPYRGVEIITAADFLKKINS